MTNPQKPSSAGNAPDTGRAAAGAAGDLHALGHYRILRPIGTGGMSEVYLAYDAKLRRQLAIKVLSDRLVGNHTFVNRFLQEGRLSRDLTHPNIVKGFACGRDSATRKYFIAMEFVDGPTAQERLDADGRFPVSAAVRIVIDIARALEYLHHHRYVHRDIKPGNILIAPDGSAKLADLGVAKFLENDSGLTSLDQRVGTPYYMPWEQGVNSGLVDPRSDIFALGATLYHLVTGYVPFPGDDEVVIARCKARGIYLPVSEHNAKLPAILDLVLERMLARDPRKRFATAGEVVEVLTASGLADEGRAATVDLPELLPQTLAPTRADMVSQAEIDTPLEKREEQIWLVRYRQLEDGAWRKIHGRTAEIILLFEEGLLPDDVIATRDPNKVYRRLKAYPEFRNVVRKPRASSAEKKKAARAAAAKRPGASRSGWNWLNFFR